MKMFDVLYENKMYQDIWNEEGGGLIGSARRHKTCFGLSFLKCISKKVAVSKTRGHYVYPLILTIEDIIHLRAILF